MTLANEFYDDIDDHLSIPIKQQGMVTLFNGIDVLQLRYYMKISAEAYIEKMGAKYLEMWHKEVPMMAECPVPIVTHESLLETCHNADGDTDSMIQKAPQDRY